MARYAALLRGVNVNGVTVKSAELAELFRSLGFTEVKTVLASGNVVFTSDADAASTAVGRAQLKATIEAGLGERFGYDAWIVLVDHDELAGIVARYPFEEVDDKHPYVVFASTQEALDEIGEFAATAHAPDRGETGRPGGQPVFYWEVPKGSSTDTVLAKFLAKPRFRTTTTTRNLRTLRKLL